MKNNIADSQSTQNSSVLRSCFTNCLLFPVIMQPNFRTYINKLESQSCTPNN